jgi:cytochrome c556
MKLPILLGALGLAAATAAFAADDPVAARQAIMDSNGAAAAVAGGMLKDEIPYSPVVAKAVIAALDATAHTFGDYFPAGSEGEPGKSSAAPKIWEDPTAFEAALAKFSTDVAGAATASGKDGPADKAAFQAAVQPVLGNCKSCHESFRLKN